jgi:tetratricopeptide (TPR) repeat protein
VSLTVGCSQILIDVDYIMRKRYEKPLLTEDYLIRMINLMVAALYQMIGLREAGKYTEAQQVASGIMEQVFGMPVDVIRRLDDTVLLGNLTHQGVLDTDRVQLLADLLMEEGALLSAQGEAGESYWSYLRALNFYLDVVGHGGAPNFPAPHDKITEVAGQLADFSLPADTLFSLAVYYEEQGTFQQAEQAFLRLLETTDYRYQVLDEIRAFYQRLLEKTDEVLIEGGVARQDLKNRLEAMDNSG